MFNPKNVQKVTNAFQRKPAAIRQPTNYEKDKETKFLLSKISYCSLSLEIVLQQYGSVDSPVPSILPTQVWVPRTLSMLITIYIWIVSCREDENK